MHPTLMADRKEAAHVDKPFYTLDEQIALLERRGVVCDESARDILLKEGYYPVVNGYNRSFLDATASLRAGDDRFREGTTFKMIYRAFLFDRGLRELTFRYLTRIEAVLRSTCSYRFCKRHPGLHDYLRTSCYTDKNSYLGGAENWDRDLIGLINTLDAVSQDAESNKAGVRWYVTHHDGVPLWVLVGELTFGNTRHLFDLLERPVQQAVCADIARLMHPEQQDERYITPAWLSRALKTLVEARNICAHDDRLFNHEFADGSDFLDVLQLMDRLITPAEAAERDAAIGRLAERYLDDIPQICRLVMRDTD